MVRPFVGESLRIAVLGALIGGGTALALASRFAPPRSVGVPVFAIVPVVRLGVAGLACWHPSRRVTLVDAAVALRTE